MKANTQMRHVTFTEVDIRHRMASLRMSYSATETLIFEVKYFPAIHLLFKNAQALDVLGGLVSAGTAPAVKLPLFSAEDSLLMADYRIIVCK